MKGGTVYLNPNASIDDRIDDLLSKMTLEEKAMQLNAASLRKTAAVEERVEPIEKSIEEQIKNGIGFIILLGFLFYHSLFYKLCIFNMIASRT